MVLFLKTYIGNQRREDKVRLMHLEQYMYEEIEEKRESGPVVDIGATVETSRSS